MYSFYYNYRASDGEVDADNYSDRMPGLYFIEVCIWHLFVKKKRVLLVNFNLETKLNLLYYFF